MQRSLPLMCRRGSQTLLPPTPQNRAVPVELMTVTFRNRTRSSASSAVAMARFSFRRANQDRWIAPTQLQRGSTVARQGDVGIIVLKRPFAVEHGLVPFQGRHD